MPNSEKNSKKTTEETLLPDEDTLCVTTEYDYEVQLVDARARVHILGTEAPSGNGTLVLRTMDGEAPSDRTYWRERPVAEATPASSAGLLTLDFTLIAPHNDDGREKTGEWDFDYCNYELAWRPTRSQDEEVLLLRDESAEKVWETDPSDTPQPIFTLMATRFYEARQVSFPDRHPDVFDDPWTPEAIREAPMSVPDGPNPLIGGSAVLDALHVQSPMPIRDASAPMEEQPGGSESEDGSISDGEPPPGPRWVMIFQRHDETDEEAADRRAGVTETPRVDLVALYRVTTGGRYEYATFGDEECASPDGGPKAPDVLIPAGTGTDVFARLSMVPPTKTRIRQQADVLDQTLDPDVPREEKEGFGLTPIPSLVTLFRDRGLDEIAHVDAPSAAPSGAAGGVVYLPNPLAAAQHRFVKARDARTRYARWKEKTKSTCDLAGLIGDTCFAKTHGRSYLQGELKKGTAGLPWGDCEFLSRPNFQSVTGTFSVVPETGDVFGMELWGAEEGGLLGHVLYGYKSQRAFLKRRRDRAAEATSKMLQSPLYRDFFYDAVQHPKTEKVKTTQGHLVHLESSLAGIGDGTHLLKRGLDRSLGTGTTLDDVTAPLEAATTMSSDKLFYEQPMFKALFVMAQRSTKNLERLVVGATPALLSVGAHVDLSLDLSVPSPLAVLGSFLTMKPGGSGSVTTDVEAGTTGEATLRVKRVGATADFEQTLVPGLEHKRPATRVRWTASASTDVHVDVGRAAQAVGLTSPRLSGVATGLDLLNVVIAGATLQAHYAEDRMEYKDALAATKMMADAAGVAEAFVDSVEELPTAARGLVAAAPFLDAAEVAWNVGGALAHDREKGLQTIDDPNVAGAVGHVALSIGSSLALGGMGAAAGVGGVALLGVAAALHWYQTWENVQENKEADPMTDWLPTNSQWGAEYGGDPAAREAIVDLVRPGNDEAASAPPVEPVKNETKQFAQKAFTFPTAVGVPPKPDLDLKDWTSGKPKRLFLSIIPEYVPKTHGTFMVDATVLDPVTEDAGSIDCAVHYVQTDEGIRYTVVPAGEILPMGGPEANLAETAEAQEWAPARTADTPVPGGGVERKLHLPVHVGPWPITEEETDTPLRDQWKDAKDRGLLDRPASENVRDRMEDASEQLSRVKWASVVEGSENLTSVLESGRFRVTGTVHFRPLRPFQPNPEVPEDDELASKEAIEYEYTG